MFLFKMCFITHLASNCSATAGGAVRCSTSKVIRVDEEVIGACAVQSLHPLVKMAATIDEELKKVANYVHNSCYTCDANCGVLLLWMYETRRRIFNQ